MKITLTLADCRSLYESHFNEDLPSDLPFITAAELVRDDVGQEEFVKRVEDLINQNQK